MTTTSTSDTRSPTGPTVAAIDIRDLHKTFPAPRGAAGPVEAVRGVDLTIRPGEIVALLGPNGAGKTTLLDMVLGFTEPTSGCVSVLGGRPADAIAAGSISSVMQTGGLLPRITVGETLQMIADLHGRTGDIEAVAERGGLTQVMSTRVAGVRGVSSSGFGSRSPSCPIPTCSSSTSRPPGSMWRPAATSGPRSGRTPHGA